MRAWHEEQPAVCVIQLRVHDVLADGIDKQRQAAVLIEAEESRHRRAALDGERRDLYAVATDRHFDIGDARRGRNNSGKQNSVEFAEDEIRGRNDTCFALYIRVVGIEVRGRAARPLKEILGREPRAPASPID